MSEIWSAQSGEGGWTPLHAAVGEGRIEVVERLLAAGADPERVDEEGWTPRALARELGEAEVAVRLA